MATRDTELQEKQAQYYRAIFDGFPMPAFIVDAEMRIHDFNAAAEPFLGENCAMALYQPSGEAFRCIYAEADGCGNSAACEKCVIRRAVGEALRGAMAQRQLHRAWLRRGPVSSRLSLLITTNALPYTDPPRVLLVVESLSDLRRTSVSRA